MLLNIIGFNVCWFGLVLLGNSFIIPALLFVIWHLAFYSNQPREPWLIASVAVIGILVDSLLLEFGLFQFDQTSHIPYWLIILWLCFATTLCHSLNVLSRSTLLQFLIGGLLAPASYIAGSSFNAVTFSTSFMNTYLLLAFVWALLFILFFSLKENIVRVEA